jgi:hypothetical protein
MEMLGEAFRSGRVNGRINCRGIRSVHALSCLIEIIVGLGHVRTGRGGYSTVKDEPADSATGGRQRRQARLSPKWEQGDVRKKARTAPLVPDPAIKKACHRCATAGQESQGVFFKVTSALIAELPTQANTNRMEGVVDFEVKVVHAGFSLAKVGVTVFDTGAEIIAEGIFKSTAKGP